MTMLVSLAGGPAAGKSSTLALLRTYESAPNVRVIFINELATYFMDWPEYIASHDDPVTRQYYIMKGQIAIEDFAMQEAADSDKEITVIITDRGVIDVYSYLTDDEVRKILTPEKAVEFETRYDLVVYLEMTDEKCFMSHNNAARHESSYREITEVSNRTREAWMRFNKSKMLFIPPAETIESKAYIVANAINKALGKQIFVRK